MRRHTVLLGIVAVSLAVLPGCSKNADNRQDQPSATVAATDVPSTVTSQPGPTQGQPATDTESPTTLTASPDAAQTTELLAQLNVIAPGLGDDRDQAVTAAALVCQQQARGDDPAMLSSDVGQEFGDRGAALSDEQRRAVAAAIAATFCHS
ncbi:hypothetical protein [Kineococcus rhizosphaerae]|uniref:DUF732 domain-containing protein n=1 Tax=Kineococcus rhizosphaerae TaxID=559628 RepID=A0A2T0R3B1_9ACTN|nr:hypothetical protein [Kineococcus rhizosphaerae]PRY14534.1 hypothetical protein CLV37_10692 [Kineococcus rhizosphaerae]